MEDFKMKLKCPVCNRSVPTYSVNGKIHCAICNGYITDDTAYLSPETSSENSTCKTPSNKTQDSTQHDNIDDTQQTLKNNSIRRKLFKHGSENHDANSDIPVDTPSFNVNEDGFYNDVPPEILSEIEHLPKEIFLKIVAGVLAIVGSIIFLIFYF